MLTLDYNNRIYKIEFLKYSNVYGVPYLYVKVTDTKNNNTEIITIEAVNIEAELKTEIDYFM